MIRTELEFLPAALEIQETPPLPASRYILWAIMGFFAIALLWSCIGEVDIVAQAPGKIVPNGRVKIIQPLESGVVKHIRVAEGQKVNQGDLLLELDSTASGADSKRLAAEELALELDRARVMALLDAIKHQRSDLDSAAVFNIAGARPEQARLQSIRLARQLDEYHAKRLALKDEERQKRHEHQAIAYRIAQLDATIPLVSERAEAHAKLLKKVLVSRMQWSELEQQRIEQVKERDVQRANLATVNAAIANTQQRQTAMQAEFQNRLLDELAQIENKLAGLEQELIKAKQRVRLQQLHAPVAGEVQQLAVHTIGGVVTPAQEVLRIVPEEGAIEIQAWVANKDIGFVHDGQPAEIKLETFPFTQYGTLDGEVLTISDDSVPDEERGLIYAAQVRLARTTMQVDEKLVPLSPGMAVTVEIKLGKRRLIEYLLSPLLRYKDESVRER
ncbi:MAG: HlyD family type I secretion periplasmic adaptor subunit [Gammaproteobacteria bacterium]